MIVWGFTMPEAFIIGDFPGGAIRYPFRHVAYEMALLYLLARIMIMRGWLIKKYRNKQTKGGGRSNMQV
jgi:hypothetical protein